MPDLPQVNPADSQGQAVAMDVSDILLVDDNPAKILALETALAPLGQNLVSATSGREALRQLLERTFATVILDVNMPGMDGFETAQMIRGRPRSAHTPIIFVSSINLADTDALRGYSLGAVDYIVAPVIPEILRAKVAVFVELHRKTQEARRQAAELEKKTRQLEESQNQLRLAERMAALGTFSAGLGHDMGNLLLPIQARLESLQHLALEPDVQDTLKGIGTCVEYLRRLASGLRMLATDISAESGSAPSTDVESWWPEVEPMLRNALPAGVQLRRSIPDGISPIAVPRHLLTQAVFNLVQNAADALRAQGTGTVHVVVAADASSNTVRVCVVDDGPGMTPDVRRRCLEPFFTTKTRALSTGLGLALVHAIMEKAGGTLEIESEPGQGASFACTFAAAAVASTEDKPVARVDIRDARKRSLVTTLLSAKGVRVAPQGEGEEATLWITDQALDMSSAGPTFLDSKPGRKLVLLGQSPESRPGLICVPDDSHPGAIRRALTEIGA